MSVDRLPAEVAVESRRMLEALLASTGDGLVEWDLEHGTIWYSERWKMLLGYEGHEIADTPDAWRALSHPDDLAAVDDLLRGHFEESWPFSHSWRMRHANGAWRWVLCRANAARNDEGRPTRLVAVFTDVQDQMEAEERQAALATAVPDLMLRLRVDGMLLDCKPASRGAGLIGRAAVGAPLVGALGAEWRAEALAAVRQAVEGGTLVGRECTAEAGEVFLELRAMKSGADEAVCIVRDITERTVAERRQRELQAEVEAMLLKERKRLAGELKIAAHMQAALLPTAPAVDGLEICCRMSPATEVGGDYFDVLSCPDGAWLAIGDVSGHGLNAGMIMLMVQSGIANLVAAHPGGRPSEVLRTLNQVLQYNIRRRMKGDDFVTLNLLRYFSDGRFISAGAHESMLVLRAATGEIDEIPTDGVWLGVLVDIGKDLVDQPGRLAPGDLLVLYTDGITESQNADGDQFGAERLAACVAARRDLPLPEICDHVFATVGAWTSECRDDRSLVLARQRG